MWDQRYSCEIFAYGTEPIEFLANMFAGTKRGQIYLSARKGSGLPLFLSLSLTQRHGKTASLPRARGNRHRGSNSSIKCSSEPMPSSSRCSARCRRAETCARSPRARHERLLSHFHTTPAGTPTETARSQQPTRAAGMGIGFPRLRDALASLKAKMGESSPLYGCCCRNGNLKSLA